MKKIALTILGFLFLASGAIGLVIPIWPTTPFVLLAAACFSASPNLRAKIMRIRFFRDYIESYQVGNGLERKTVIYSLAFLWTMLALSAFMMKRLWALPLFAIIGVSVTVHILHIAKPRAKRKRLCRNVAS
ncbi:MAG: YbaN family protein [Christensenellales bacterium]|jgi:uncharacterized membrane protein YbaN (DUF454 family)